MRGWSGAPDPGRAAVRWWLVAVLALLPAGCSRSYYRQKADREVYSIERQRLIDPRWTVPLRPVEPDPRSRMRDPYDPDREPFPPDDPAALRFQVSEQLHPWHGFGKRIRRRGLAPIEDKSWLAMLPRGPDGAVPLNAATAMQLAVIHGRDYQTQVENLYLTALDVSLARFAFQVQPFWSQAIDFQHSGSPANESNQLLPVGRLGFTKQFYSGAQLLVDFANNLVWEYNGAGFSTASSTLLIALTQPLLRGAFARVVTQPLSLQERRMLYEVRLFARYRRILYVEVVAGGGYLGLLGQLQGIRNSEENLRNLERNLAESEELLRLNRISLSQRDQVALQYQQQQVGLLSQQAGLETNLDAFRARLGLPPDLPMTIDDAPLRTFELSDPRIDELRRANDELNLTLVQQEEATPKAVQLEVARALLANFEALDALLDGAREEMRRWRTALGLIDDLGEVPLADVPDDPGEAFAFNLAQDLHGNLVDSDDLLDRNIEAARALLATIEDAPSEQLAETYNALRELVADDFRARASEVFVTQTQVRLFLIELTPVPLTLEQAIAVALANRQDLMNSRAQVADAWRNVEVAANALKAGLDITYQSLLATDPNFDGVLRFDASASLHRFGLRFDAPIVRRAERNAYRAAWIAYQRARRAYMLNHDEVVRQIRLDMRDLTLSRRQFAIGREQLVTAARNVEESEINLRTSIEPDAGLTLLLLQALESLLGARNGLIGDWVGYETARMGLYRDMDIMDIDARGVWTNEHFEPAVYAAAHGGAGLPGASPDPPTGPLDLPPLPEPFVDGAGGLGGGGGGPGVPQVR